VSRAEDPSSAPVTARAGRARWRDPRVWIGIAVTAFCVWLALRGVSFREVGRDIARANWVVLLSLSLPAYAGLVWLRALRWRHLTDPIQPIGSAALARAVSVGFMANNVLPLRVGEVARAWYLARETGASPAALFGTVLLERVIDTVCVVAMVAVVASLFGAEGEAALARGAMVLVPAAALPSAGMLALRAWPEPISRGVAWLLRPLPRRLQRLAEQILRRFAEGLGALRGGRHLFWIALQSIAIWFGLSTLTIVAAFWALGIDLGSPLRVVGAAWAAQAAIGVAVALPSAPGFFGLFHYACRFALERFGVPTETAVAAGTLIHIVMWVTLTTAGLAVLRIRRTTLSEMGRAAGAGSVPASR
jgi:uncharacterized protein (TIRG00374 family)